MTDDQTFSAEEAVRVQRELRRALGKDAERFPIKAFVGMISDEIEEFRAAGRTDEDIAAIVSTAIGRHIAPETLAEHYAPPELRRRD